MSKTFDLSTLNLSAGTHAITVKSRAKNYPDSQPSNTVWYEVKSTDTPEKPKSFGIESIATYFGNDTSTKTEYISSGEYTVETNENGDTVFHLGAGESKLTIIPTDSSKTTLSDACLITNDNVIEIYLNGSLISDEGMIIELIIYDTSNGIPYIECGGNLLVFSYWKYTPVTIRIYYENGQIVLNAVDKDGYGGSSKLYISPEYPIIIIGVKN